LADMQNESIPKSLRLDAPALANSLEHSTV
jgi:hypothetical protein